MSVKEKLFTLLLTSLLFCNFAEAEEKHLFIVSGVIVNSNSGKKIEDFVAMIEKKTGYALKPYYVNSYQRLSDTLLDKPDSLAWTCGAPYVHDAKKHGQQLIAIPLYKGVPIYYSYIVARKSSKADKLLDFKNKIFVYSDNRSNSAYVAPSALLKDAGYNISDFFRVKIHSGVHEKSIEALYRGLADVGAIDEYVWDEYTKSKPKIKNKLHVIQKIGPFAFTPIVAGSGVDKRTVKKIQKALVDMSDAEYQKFKNDFDMDGFVVKDPSFYDSIRANMHKIDAKF